MQDPTSSGKVVRGTLTGSGNVHVRVPKVKLASVAAPYIPDPDSDFDNEEDSKPVVLTKRTKKRKSPHADGFENRSRESKNPRGGAEGGGVSAQAGPSRFATNSRIKTEQTPASTESKQETAQEPDSLDTYPDDSLDFKIHKRVSRERSRTSSSKPSINPEANPPLNSGMKRPPPEDGDCTPSIFDADEPPVISDSDDDIRIINDVKRGILNPWDRTARQRKLDQARDDLNDLNWDQEKGKKLRAGAKEKTNSLTSPLAILLGIYTPPKSTPPPPQMKTTITSGIATRVPVVEIDDDATASGSDGVDMDGGGGSAGSGGSGGGGVKEHTARKGSQLQKGTEGAETVGNADVGQPTVVPKRWTSLKQFQKDVGKKVRSNRRADDEAFEAAQKVGMRPSFFLRGGNLPQHPLILDPLRGDQVPVAINRFLRKYQRQGVEFFYERYRGLKTPGEHGIKVTGGILGDDMGLGKTIQVIAFLSAIMHKTGTKEDEAGRKLRSYKVRNRAEGQGIGPATFGPTCLIVCPTTLMDNWERELETWGYFEWGRLENKADEKRVLNRYKQGFFDIVLTSHATLRAVKEAIEDLHFSVVIIDEAHALKNPKSYLSIAAKGLKADARFALTGTLVQNRYSEVWSILDFVAPGQIGSQQNWRELISNPLDEGNKHNATMEETVKARDIAYTLHNEVMPNFFLRRTKAEVAEELPEKNDQVIFCPLTPIQEIVYERITRCKAMQHYLQKDDPCYCGAIGDKGKPKTRKECHFPPEDSDPDYSKLVLRYLSILNKISSHIALIYPQATDSMVQNKQSRKLLNVCFPDPGNMDDEEEHSDTPVLACDAEFRQMTAYRAGLNVNLSGKWQVLTCLLQAWHEDTAAQNQVLIFSTSVRLLNILEEYANREGYKSVTLTGKVTGKDRMDVVDAFQNNKDCFIFFISTLAGGVGLNLTAANKVIIFDPSWNPANDLQAMDRAFRMGQKRDVDVYRLISKGTIEENIYERQLRKESAMRIIYTASLEPRRWAGTEKNSGQKNENDLYGARNMFTYKREGSTLQRDARLLETETTVTGGNNILKDLKTLQVETAYADDSDGAFETKETEDGGLQELDVEKNERELLDFLGLAEHRDAGAAAVSELAKVNSGLMTRAHFNGNKDSEAERKIYEAGKALLDDPDGKRKARMMNAYQLAATEVEQKSKSKRNVKREGAEPSISDTPHAPKILTGALIDDDDDD